MTVRITGRVRFWSTTNLAGPDSLNEHILLPRNTPYARKTVRRVANEYDR
jgi:hypothetical protein